MQSVFSLAFVLGVLVAVIIVSNLFKRLFWVEFEKKYQFCKQAGGPPSEEKKRIIDECKAQEKATDDDAQQLLNYKIPTGPNGKCFLACVNEKTGVVS